MNNQLKEKLNHDYKNIESYLFLSLLLTNYTFSITMLTRAFPIESDSLWLPESAVM